MTSSWRKMIEEAMSKVGETWEDLVSITLSDQELDEEFDAGWGTEEGKPFTAWTRDRVYFPVSSEGGAEWCSSAPRNPNEEAMEHVGKY